MREGGGSRDLSRRLADTSAAALWGDLSPLVRRVVRSDFRTRRYHCASQCTSHESTSHDLLPSSTTSSVTSSSPHPLLQSACMQAAPIGVRPSCLRRHCVLLLLPQGRCTFMLQSCSLLVCLFTLLPRNDAAARGAGSSTHRLLALLIDVHR